MTLSNHQAPLASTLRQDWSHSCFYFQEVNLFQRADKESGGGWKFPLLHHWPKWKQSAHSRWTLWFPLPIPQTCQVWGHVVHPLFTPHIRESLTRFLPPAWEEKRITILLTCSCQFCVMFDYCSAAPRLPVEVKAEAAQPSTSGYHTQLQRLLKKKKKLELEFRIFSARRTNCLAAYPLLFFPEGPNWYVETSGTFHCMNFSHNGGVPCSSEEYYESLWWCFYRFRFCYIPSNLN